LSKKIIYIFLKAYIPTKSWWINQAIKYACCTSVISWLIFLACARQ